MVFVKFIRGLLDFKFIQIYATREYSYTLIIYNIKANIFFSNYSDFINIQKVIVIIKKKKIYFTQIICYQVDMIMLGQSFVISRFVTL